MTELDQFTSALVRAAASYHMPPDTPAEAMWGGIQDALAARAVETSEDVALASYHEPPEPPREAMWERIEAAWTLRQSAPEGAREAGLAKLEPTFALGQPADAVPVRERRSATLWLSGVAAAALILVGIMIGRGTAPSGADGSRLATSISDRPGASIEPPGIYSGLSPEPLAFDAEFVEPLETNRQLLAAQTTPRPSPNESEPADRTSDDASEVAQMNRRARVARHATDAHLERAETLFAAFRVDDDDPADLGHLASSARSLLGETRLLLAMPIDRPIRERALLEQIELVLAQIARLGPDVPDFERHLAYEGVERLGDMTSLGRTQTQVGT